ncbi:hypothetical protein BmR1_04g05480 [Babesia microti strain RI]|uniref:Voltage-dependent anion-selective channel protein n=1 Tax=Babesia microti (strain RI) TaxID=1133968 RepID=I7I9M4_BABMR|nr:hypothetical protein BmR1_04g05480 [Babesia microti strain RI]CCF75294.1 hypothetical protein BmR1_04g05480 [Babesia microti strain RI]|eukprot:XP_012649702.1 hypothetical protein BmR1_04g05480 [Babesia microti strain RI]
MEALDFDKLINSCCTNLLTKNYLGDNALTFEHKSSTDVADMTNVVNILKNGTLKSSTKFKKNINPFSFELKSTKSGDKSLDFIASIPRVKGMSIGTYIENKLKSGTNFNVSYQYSNKIYNGRIDFEPISRKMTCFGVNNLKLDFGTFTFGSQFVVDFKTKNINYALATAYETNLNDSFIKTSLKFKHANYKLFHPSVGSDIILSTTKGMYKKFVGAEAEYFIFDNKLTFTVGAQWYLTPHNIPKPTFVKAKCTQDYKAEVAFTHALTDNISCTLSSQGILSKEFNPQDLKFGFKLSVS